MRGSFNPMLVSVCVSAVVGLTNCGGGASPDSLPTIVAEAPPSAPPPANTPPPDGSDGAGNPPAGVAPPSSSCTLLPPLPARPSRVRNVKDFGATVDDLTDDTAAIQRAINALSPGEWLVFPQGRYLHNTSIRVKTPNVVLWSEGATLHATNASNQAMWLEADGASIYNFTLTAVTENRRTTPWESRIAVFGGSNPRRLLKNNVVRGNRLIWSGPAGSALANSASSAGIFVYHATNFLVAENQVSRSLADGIHVTAGSSNGKVLKNTVTETGDDMIAVVSYLGMDASTPASKVAAEYESRKAGNLNRGILIAHNTVSGQYWGRGITVVGGDGVRIENNSISKTTHAAGVYLAREVSYLTFGVRNVLVRHNTIRDVQTTAPDYITGKPAASFTRTRHGGVEIYSHLFVDEAAIGWLKNALAVENILVENNIIDGTIAEGVRVGTGDGRTWSYSGRSVTGGSVGLISLTGNKLSRIGTQAISILNRPTSSYNVQCESNTKDGSVTSHNVCSGPKPPVSVPALCAT